MPIFINVQQVLLHSLHPIQPDHPAFFGTVPWLCEQRFLSLHFLHEPNEGGVLGIQQTSGSQNFSVQGALNFPAIFFLRRP